MRTKYDAAKAIVDANHAFLSKLVDVLQLIRPCGPYCDSGQLHFDSSLNLGMRVTALAAMASLLREGRSYP
jgi:hypothetical protein